MADNTGLFGDGMMGGYGNNITAANIIRSRYRQPIAQAAMENAEPNSSIRNVPDNAFQAWLNESGQRLMNPTDTIAQGVQNFTKQDPVDMGMSLLNGGMGGALGTFAGVGAKTADVAKLELAQKLKQAGVADREIHAQTGWTFGFPDGKPRFEIDDSAALYTPGAVRARVKETNQAMFDESVHARQLRNIMDEQGVRVGDAKDIFREKFGREPMTGAGAGARYSEASQLKHNEDEYYKRLTSPDVLGRTNEFLNHPVLYKSYPNTGSMPTHITEDMSNKGFGGEFTGDSIKLNPEYAYGMESGKSIQLHELQHAIQQQEGFARGGSPVEFAGGSSILNKEKFNSDILNRLKNIDKSISDQALTDAGHDINKLSDLQNEVTRTKLISDIQNGTRLNIPEALLPMGQYRRLAGEAEARLTQARMNMTQAERAASYPPSMFDVPVDQQIVRFGDGPAMSTNTNNQPLVNALRSK